MGLLVQPRPVMKLVQVPIRFKTPYKIYTLTTNIKRKLLENFLDIKVQIVSFRFLLLVTIAHSRYFCIEVTLSSYIDCLVPVCGISSASAMEAVSPVRQQWRYRGLALSHWRAGVHGASRCYGANGCYGASGCYGAIGCYTAIGCLLGSMASRNDESRRWNGDENARIARPLKRKEYTALVCAKNNKSDVKPRSTLGCGTAVVVFTSCTYRHR